MKVLHVLSSLCQGGAENYVVDLVIAMRRLGIEPAVACISSARELGRCEEHERKVLQRLAREGIPVFRIGHRARRLPFLGGWRLRSILNQWQPDVVHGHLLAAVLFQVFSFSRLPFFYTHHNSRFRAVRRLAWLFRRRKMSVVAISSTQYQRLVELALEPACYVYNAVDLDRFASRKESGETHAVRHMIAVTNLRPVKDLQTMIRAFAQARKRLREHGIDVDLRLVGEGPMRDELKTMAHRLGVADSVSFLGAREDVPELLQESDLFVMSSLSEGLPISLLEAVSSSLPSVVTDVGACREIVDGAEAGMVVPAGDPAALAEAMTTMLENPERYREAMEQCRRARERFSIETAARQHQALYQMRRSAVH